MKGMDDLIEGLSAIEVESCKPPKMGWKMMTPSEEANKFLDYLQADPLTEKSDRIEKIYQKPGFTKKLEKRWIDCYRTGVQNYRPPDWQL